MAGRTHSPAVQQSLTPRHVLGHREQHTCRRIRCFPKAICVLLTPVVAKADKTAFHFYTQPPETAVSILLPHHSALRPPHPSGNTRGRRLAPPGPTGSPRSPSPARPRHEQKLPRSIAALWLCSWPKNTAAEARTTPAAFFLRVRSPPHSPRLLAERPRPSPGRFSPSSPEDLRAPSPPRETAGPSCGRRSGPVPALTCRASRAAASATRASILPLRERAEAEVATPERKRKRRNEGQRPRAEGRAPRVRAAAVTSCSTACRRQEQAKTHGCAERLLYSKTPHGARGRHPPPAASTGAAVPQPCSAPLQ